MRRGRPYVPQGLDADKKTYIWSEEEAGDAPGGSTGPPAAGGGDQLRYVADHQGREHPAGGLLGPEALPGPASSAAAGGPLGLPGPAS